MPLKADRNAIHRSTNIDTREAKKMRDWSGGTEMKMKHFLVCEYPRAWFVLFLYLA